MAFATGLFCYLDFATGYFRYLGLATSLLYYMAFATVLFCYLGLDTSLLCYLGFTTGPFGYIIEIELSTISPESIVTTHGKTFVKTADLAYFGRLRKHSKVWDHGTQLLEVQRKKKYWLCNNCKLLLSSIPKCDDSNLFSGSR